MASSSYRAYCIAMSQYWYDCSINVYEASVNIANNTSVVNFSCSAQQGADSGWNFNGTTRSDAATITVNVNGTTKSFTIGLNNGSLSSGSTSGSVTVAHNSNGSKTISFSASGSRGGGNYGGDTYVYEANSCSGTLTLTNIDRNGGQASVSLISRATNSVTLKLSSNVNSSLACYRLNNGTWVEFSTAGTDVDKDGGGSIIKTITGLAANTSYTFDVQFRRDLNNVWSSSGTLQFTTDQNSIIGSAINISDTTAGVTWSGYQFSNGTSDKYQYSFNGGSWTNCATDTYHKLTGLSPSTKYTFSIRVVNNSGTVISKTCTVTFTTTAANSWKNGTAFIKQNGSWARGNVFIKQNGSWVKSTGTFIKKN